MKPTLLVLLALSLAGNFVLAFLAWHQPVTEIANVPVARGPVASQTTTPGANPSPQTASSSDGAIFQWPATVRAEDLPGLVARLRAAGFPAATIRAIVQQQVGALFSSRYGALATPYWKMYVSSPERLATNQALNKERRELTESLLGADARPSASMDPAGRERRYGDLSSAKIDAIEAINRDYGDLQALALEQRSRNPAGNGADFQKQFEFLQEEQRKDIAAILTPAEQEQYEMRTSPAAGQTMSNLRNVDVNEDEYAAVFRLQQAFNRTNPQPTGRVDPDAMARRDAAQDQLNENVRSVLGDDRYYEYLKSADYRFGQVATFTAQYPAVSQAATYQLYQLDRATQAAVSQLSPTLTREQRQAELNKISATYGARTQQLLGDQAAAAYGVQSASRIFQQPNQRGIQPAIKLGGG